ncbi:PTS N-acetylglucosamine transporter subunit IIBC [Lactobacillus bombicola]|jgi:mannose/fructose-specific phosphotransferase system component IIA|uniref:PTS N-acetylglucosamine transporter subunit IIBC n=1 Tax=Lactobacillus bombicola TaxID=1505723 RepID=A0ABX9LUD2_9LACO|nr:PTS N-acetylglucosamine transporter subunit IIBC [Lactobacillus bombicola]RHW50895.1 PTS N-acetylglucosamine transporter subunit IIBC [Lactobacillus bombicola]
MKQIIIISHKTMAQGMVETIKFFAGNIQNLHFICAYENEENEFPIDKLIELIDSFNSQDQVFLLTDLLGGSVNQNCTQLINERHVNVITGINLAIALSIILDTSDYLSNEKISELIKQAKSQMIYMNNYNDNNESDDE